MVKAKIHFKKVLLLKNRKDQTRNSAIILKEIRLFQMIVQRTHLEMQKKIKFKIAIR